MASFVPKTSHLREVLLFCYHSRKTATEAHSMLVETYGEHALSQSQCYRWYKKFSGGNFELENETRGKPAKKFEDAELQALLDEDDSQTQSELAEQLGVDQASISRRLRDMGKIHKLSRWVPYELSERQQENRRTTCEMLLARFQRKSFLHRIVTGDEKWIFFENPKRQKSWVDPGAAASSTVRPNRFGKKTMLCVWWDQNGIVYYELLKPGETVNTARYLQQMIDLEQAARINRPQYRSFHDKLILLHDNAPAHTAAVVKKKIEELGWETLAHSAYSPDLAPSDYHLFTSMGHALAEQRFTSYENVRIWLENWFASKSKDFYWRGIHKLPERWAECVANEGRYFE